MANIKDVALYARLSPSCVSKYLRNKDSVREENKRLIEDAIHSLQYVPSNVARSLRNGKTMTIKALMPTITLSFFAEIFEQLRVPLLDAGYHLILQTIVPNQEFSERDFAFSDGAIIAFPNDSSDILGLAKLLSALNKPLVAMHGHDGVEGVVSVWADIRQGMERAAEYMVLHGRKKIAYVGGNAESIPSFERFRGFCAAVPEELRGGIFRRDFTMEWGYTAATRILESGEMPDGILCENDGSAAGVIKCFSKHGVSIPGDVWVFGFDDSPFAEIYTPSISSVSIPSAEMSKAAVNSLLRVLSGDKAVDKRFDCRLVLRETTGDLQKG